MQFGYRYIGYPNTIWLRWNDVAAAIGKDCDISLRASYRLESASVVAVHLVLTHDPRYAFVIDHMPTRLQLQSDSTIAITWKDIVDVTY